MKDPFEKLIRQTENVHAPRHFRFKSLDEVKENEEIIKEYVAEAIDIEIKKIPIPRDDKFDEIFPEELKEYLKNDEEFKRNFDNLTKGRQKGYMLYFSGAKQSKTRINRIEKSKEKIALGLGYNE